MLFSLPLLALACLASAADFDWDCTKSLGTCNNACYAIHCKNHKDTLRYDSDEKKRSGRRTDSGCNKNPCNTAPTKSTYGKFGNSCDEFPFASTRDGGKNAVLRCVDGSENSSEGGQLGNFYKKIKNGDSFKVFIKNYRGARYCENKPNCANDGGEFKLSGSSFTNAKVRRDLSEFETFNDTESALPSTGFRKFMGEDGVERLWLSTNQEVTVVGRDIWGEEGGSKITHELFE